MRKLIYILCLGLLVTSCDDGDIFEVSLDFGDTFEQCGELVFYKIKATPPETLSIKINNLTFAQILDVDDTNVYLDSFPLGSNNVFNYRSYGSSVPNNLFCNDIPPSNLNITNDEVSVSGQVKIFTVLVEDDNDGIPSELEDINGNGNLDDDDTDNDGIPDYLDVDDDGDNVLTSSEQVNYTLQDGLANAIDTDGDGVPNYLDNDDDGDGVLTRDEENINANLNPTDDVTDPNAGVADYLNNQVTTTVPATEFRAHAVRMIYTVTVTVSNISLPSIIQQTLNFGTLEDDALLDSRPVTPIFN